MMEDPALRWDLGPVRRRHTIRRVAAVVVAVLVVAVAAWLLRPGSDTGPVTLAEPAGHHGEAGFPIGFPHTELGAASAAAATLEAAWTLDETQATAAAQLYAAPEQQEAARAGAVGATRGWRRTLGLPEEGSLPAGAAMRSSTIGIRWQERAEDQILVSVLVQVTATKGDSGPLYSSPYAMNLLMTWHPTLRGGDWVNTPDTRPVAAPPAAAPGTPQFTAAGWRPIAHTGPAE
ncbi:hypothetical protein [Nonomuraea africana]|uniref:Conjugative transposon protein TcpC n=1 Tax=Nonomuraea africana TaxID=46171 RepID=A0ABR9KF96_9ACTN|nr:hypothetical protein [Nonomuraea africana]MBE1560202.1 hypothetical protein [Nonomuraea africana]